MGHCSWADTDEITKRYHDREWGIPAHDDRRMFEYLTLECLQCGLSFGLMLRKREIFRSCFDGFDYSRIAQYGEADIERILSTEGMLKSRRKVEAIINNAKRYLEVRAEFGSFCKYLWAYTEGKTVIYEGHAQGAVPASNGLSARIAKDLKRRGFTFVGSVTIYSHLQASGLINDHADDCPCFKAINQEYPTVYLEPDSEE